MPNYPSLAMDDIQLDPNTSLGSSFLHRKAPASSAPSTDTNTSRLWSDRVKHLPRLHVRALTLIRLLVDGLEIAKHGDPILPNSTLSWFKQIYSECEENGFTERVDVLRVTMEKFTTHKYINLQEYEDHIDMIAEQLEFTQGKVWNILVCANLAVLLVDVIEMSALWEEKSPEDRTLMIDDIVLRFPKQFMAPDSYRGQNEAKVLLELRTQALIQAFLDSIPTDLAGWNTITMVDDVLRVKSPPDEDDIQGNQVHEKYVPLASPRVLRLKLLMPEDADTMVIERNLQKEFPLEKTNRSVVTWILSQCNECKECFLQEPSEKDLKAPNIDYIVPHEPLHENQDVFLPESRLIQHIASVYDSEEDAEDSLDPEAAAKAVANHRGPKDARIWAIQEFGDEEAHVSASNADSPPQRRRSKTRRNEVPSFRPRSKSPVFVRSASASVEPEEPSAYDFIKNIRHRPSLGNSSQFPNTQMHFKSNDPSLPSNGLGLADGNQRRTSAAGGPNGNVKRSLLDPQPNARKISFDSPTARGQSTSPDPVTRKRAREPSPVFAHSPSSDAEDDDFKERFTPKVNPEKLRRSRASAAARHSDPTEELLNRIHGPASPERGIEAILDRFHGPAKPPPAAPGRKGLGYAWSREQEEVLIELIGEYGPAWADLARTYCGPGGKLEGRDQAKLKDKARNLKEKMLREGIPFPRHFELVTPQGNREQAQARIDQEKLLRKANR